MTKLFKQMAIFAVVLGLTTVVSTSAFAASGAGDGLLSDFKAAVTGNLGVTAGLAVSLVGLYMWLWNQVSWGIIVAIGGALVTAFPGIYDSIADFGTAALSNSAGTLTTTDANI